MTEHLKQKLNDSAVLRWSVLALVAFTMLCGYFLTDVMSPLKPMLEKELLWDSLDYGFFTSAYGWFNVFLLMLIFGGIILDKMGVRFTGMGLLINEEDIMLTYTYIEHGKFELREKPEPEIVNSREAIVRVTLGSICTSDLHIKHGSVPRAVPGITVGHEMVGVVEKVGADVTSVKPGDRVTVNVETFCGECFFCRRGYVNNCTDPNGGWALGCRIDGGQAEYVRVPYADQGLNRIPDTVSDEQALFVGDVLATGFWAARISEITEEDTVLIIGAGPTGICTLLCVMLKKPRRIIVCEKSPERIRFVREHYPDVLVVEPENCKEFVIQNSEHGGADVVLEVAGSKDTFRLAWECARPNAVVTIVALYDEPQILPLPDMYGKNLIFKTGGVDGCDCAEILNLIEEGKIDTTPLITHRFPLNEIEEAYRIFENKLDGVIKVAIYQ